MSMSRKNYEAIAKILKEAKYRDNIIDDLADYFEDDNPNFNRDRFIAACLKDNND